MADFVAFLTANVEGLIAVLFAVHALAVAVVNLTPTPSPRASAVLATVYRGIEILAGVVTKRAKERPDGA